jgi:hypothetical protein
MDKKAREIERLRKQRADPPPMEPRGGDKNRRHMEPGSLRHAVRQGLRMPGRADRL